MGGLLRPGSLADGGSRGRHHCTPGLGTITWLPHELVEALGISWPSTKPLMALGSETIVQTSVPEPAGVLQAGVALATLGLLAQLRSRMRGFADAA